MTPPTLVQAPPDPLDGTGYASRRIASRHWRVRGAIVAAGSALVVLAGFWGRLGGSGAGPAPASATPIVAAAIATSPTPDAMPSPAPRERPDTVDCQTVDPALCLRVAFAAVRELPTDLPRVTSVTVWRSIICDSSVDCPPEKLRLVVPLGSALVAFADGGPAALVDVVIARQAAPATPPDSWIVRWMPAPATDPSPAVPPGERAPVRSRPSSTGSEPELTTARPR